ncbi:MAG: hypothetical protein HYY90_03680 [Candidatus Omnitrophica bacterium]|nr:hypothetical protein [Candidatus Omnitrophota bacterium]MBI3083442.1 hypothetical protein [Candidatus Omnitrophota bacterium]
MFENGSRSWLPFRFPICYTGLEMKNDAARQIGGELKAILERLKGLAKQERASHGPDAEAIEIAVVNLDSAIEILTE